MPFASKAQQRFMFSQHPELAREFAEKTDFESLPERKRKDKKKMSVKQASCNLSQEKLNSITRAVENMSPAGQFKMAVLCVDRLNNAAKLERVFGYKYASVVSSEHMTKVAIWGAIASALPHLVNWGSKGLSLLGRGASALGNGILGASGSATAGGAGGVLNRGLNATGNAFNSAAGTLENAGKNLTTGPVGQGVARTTEMAKGNNFGARGMTFDQLKSNFTPPAAPAAAAPAPATPAPTVPAAAASKAPAEKADVKPKTKPEPKAAPKEEPDPRVDRNSADFAKLPSAYKKIASWEQVLNRSLQIKKESHGR